MNINSILRPLLVGAALSAGSLFASTIKISNTPIDGNLDGGEFFVQSAAFGDYVTFCLEKHVPISMPSFPASKTYNYTVSPMAELQNDVLSKGSAWLFAQFYLGTLKGPTNTGNYNDSQFANAGLLQQAFWYLEDESLDGHPAGTPNDYVDLAILKFGSLAGAKANISLTSKVQVLNLWGPNGEDKQSMLVVLPGIDLHYVPDSGMTAALLGLGLLSLVAFRRKL